MNAVDYAATIKTWIQYDHNDVLQTNMMVKVIIMTVLGFLVLLLLCGKDSHTSMHTLV